MEEIISNISLEYSHPRVTKTAKDQLVQRLMPTKGGHNSQESYFADPAEISDATNKNQVISTYFG